ncbi:MAG: tRNA lysidine(34) synthetase TilS [Nitrospinaceae bacterium]|nr:tRNA lysidine(34) synthetase TilS [Nitrospinaceae bacterium]NIR54860.1 tRNA lysidine(34) synthetase TilS [Nitrospinaceae bacterium]NIS85285.1 tRNA lysidine(34) synthetase TilS [Nitrospinaceae bacterium]NIT82098.1 tRNA lysidine(34) synthetase TilS [Nitrospinaceae bacterium]NIU44359.1 tRNA lysidine(34) synthetase TilS [Nitrospinaceae bacterium]
MKSFFIDAKVPRESRRKIPILTTASDEIIWVYGWRISETYRVTDKTRKILVIEGHQT